jgi:hypothetical protein
MKEMLRISVLHLFGARNWGKRDVASEIFDWQ